MSNKRFFLIFLGMLVSANIGKSHKILNNNFSETKQDLKEKQEIPIVLNADDIFYDDKEKIFRAKGNVLFIQEKRSIRADCVTYLEKEDKVIAKGNIRIQDANGDIVFADCIELSGDFKKGFITEVKVLKTTRERIAALRVTKIGEGREEYEMISYTPCERCQDQLDRAPVWSLHSRHIEKDEKANAIMFTDSHLSFLGVPIAYAPYFYMPIRRSSGFLVPGMGFPQALGYFLAAPYYWAISDDKDMILTPYYTAQGGQMLTTKYRQHLNNGMIRLDGAYNITDSERFYRNVGATSRVPAHSIQTGRTPASRVYLHGNLDYDLSQHWKINADEWWLRDGDKSFFKTRPFFEKRYEPYLMSNSKIQGFYEHHFFQAQTYRYQGLTDLSRQRFCPAIAPEMLYQYISPTLPYGSYVTLNAQTLSLFRHVGEREQRGTLESLLECPLIGPFGNLFFPFLRLREDIYFSAHTERLLPGQRHRTRYLPAVTRNQIEKKTLSKGRFFPQAGLEWKLPWFIPQVGTLITPRAQILTAPCRINFARSLPDADCEGVDFTDGHLFQTNRYPGRDRVDDGSRINYGLQIDKNLQDIGRSELLIGQSCSFTTPEEKLRVLGIRKGRSDIVGRLHSFLFDGWVDLLYRFRLSHKTWAPHYQEGSLAIGPKIFRPSIKYLYFNRNARINDPSGFNQGTFGLSSTFLKFWTLQLTTTYNLQNTIRQKKGALNKGGSLMYKDDCFLFSISVQKAYYVQRELKPGMSVLFSIIFKNLGGFKLNGGELFQTQEKIRELGSTKKQSINL